MLPLTAKFQSAPRIDLRGDVFIPARELFMSMFQSAPRIDLRGDRGRAKRHGHNKLFHASRQPANSSVLGMFLSIECQSQGADWERQVALRETSASGPSLMVRGRPIRE